MSEHQRGLIYGAAAYVMWGLFPLYFPLLEQVGAVEILANRIVWSLVVLAAVVSGIHRWRGVLTLARNRRRLMLLGVAALTIALNWGFYIYAVNSDRVVEAALGYFINPLVSVVFGVVLLKESLTRAQWVAVGLGVVAVAVLTVGYGHVPWLALLLAFSFGTYGLVKKVLDAGAVESLTVETTLLTPLALVYFVWLTSTGDNALTTDGVATAALLAGTGLLTAVPLLLFSASATRIPLTWIGLLQYITPTMQFVIGVVVYGEHMSATRWAGFGLVWMALVVLTVDSLSRVRRPALSQPAR